MMFESYRDLKDFSYNPDSDREFQAYKDRLGRESQSAQNQTYSNLTGMSGRSRTFDGLTAARSSYRAYVKRVSMTVSTFR